MDDTKTIQIGTNNHWDFGDFTVEKVARLGKIRFNVFQTNDGTQRYVASFKRFQTAKAFLDHYDLFEPYAN